MSIAVFFSWNIIVALGTVAVGIIFALKMKPDVAERVSIQLVDACKEFAVAGYGIISNSLWMAHNLRVMCLFFE